MLQTIEHKTYLELSNYFKTNNLKDRKLLLAISGGIDSVVMYQIILKLSMTYCFKIGLAHMNYRTTEISNKSMLLCKELSIKNSHPFYLRIPDKILNNFEHNARIKRYSFLNHVKEVEGYDSLITAHHKNDLIESLYMNALDKSNISLIPFSDKSILRPFLSVKSSEICNYAKNNSIIFHEDPTNEDLKYRRNEIRNIIFPRLKNKRIIINDLIYNNERSIRLYNDFIRKFNINKKLYVKYDKTFKSILIDRLFLNKFTNDEFKIIIQGQVKKYYNEIIRKTDKYWSNIYRISKSDKKNIDININIRIKVYFTKEYVVIHRNSTELLAKKMSHLVKWGGGLFCVSDATEGSISEALKVNNNNILICPSILLRNKIFIRRWYNGDKYPIGMQKNKKISTLFNEKKIFTCYRDKIPLVIYKDNIIWIPGIHIPKNNFLENKQLKIIEWISNNDNN